MGVRIIQGDCRDVLRTLPAESIHCVITSPPYWGLRDYGLPPSVWGGSSECEHEWGEEIIGKGQRQRNSAEGGLHEGRQTDKLQEIVQTEYRQGNFCRHCGAWRGCLGLEPTPDLFVRNIVEVFREVKRVLRRDGTLWLNLGDSFACSSNGRSAADTKAIGNDDRTFRDKPFGTAVAGLKPKDMVGAPWMVAFALRSDGWWLRSEIIWEKPNCLPSSVRDRPGTSHEQVFLLSKSERYFYDPDAVRVKTGQEAAEEEYAAAFGSNNGADADRYSAGYRKRSKTLTHPGGRNLRTVWSIPTQPYRGGHFASFPEKLVEPCLSAGTSEHGCCPECGAPWRRIVEKGEPLEEWRKQCGADSSGGYDGTAQKDYLAAGAQNASDVKARILAGMVERKTVDWQPSCPCGCFYDPRPCVCLDPFGGTGTVGVVASKLGRDAILIELNPDYIPQIRERNAQPDLFSSHPSE